MSNSQEKSSLLHEIKSNGDTIRALFEGLPDLVFHLDINGNILEFLSPESHPDYAGLKGENITKILPDTVTTVCLENIRVALKTGKVQTARYSLTQKTRADHFESRIVAVDATEVLYIARNITDFQHSTDKTANSEKLIQDITESISQTIFLLELKDLRVIFTNRQQQFLGYSQEELADLQQFGTKFIPQEDFEILTEQLLNWIEGTPQEQPGHFEYRIRAKDQSMHWLHLTTTVFRLNEDGSLKQFLGVVEDITEKKQAIHQLQESEEQYRVLVENAFLAISFYDIAANRFAFSNNRTIEMLGIDKETFLSNSPARFSPSVQPDGRKSRDIMVEYVERLRNGEEKIRYEWNYLKADGSFIESESTISLVNFRGREHFMIIAHDISERKQAEKKRIEQENKYQSIFESTTDGIAVLAPNSWTIIDCNQTLANLLRQPKQSLLGKTIPAYSPATQADGTNSSEKQFQLSLRMKHAPQTHKLEWRFMRDESDFFDSEMIINPIKGDSNGYWLGAIRDISKRKKREKELVRSRKLYHEIARNLPDSGIIIFDHELRYILAEGPALEQQGFIGSQMENKTPFEIFSKEDAGRLAGAYHRVLAGEEIEMEHRYNGFIFETRMVPLKDEGEEVYAGMIVSRDITKNQQLKEAIGAVANRTNVVSENNFFRELVQGLSHIFQVGHILVGEYYEGSGEIQTAAYFHEGNFIDEYVYLLEGTPCQHVMAGSTYACPNGVQHAFPADEELVENNLESYLGMPLVDSTGKTVGLISLMDTQPMDEVEYKISILKAFTARAGAELERTKTTRELQISLDEISSKNQELEKYIASNVELERFAYVASHDLREPLRNISGFAQLLEKRYGDKLDEAGKDYIDFIVKGVHTMNQFIKDLLNYSRITSMESTFKEVPTQDLLEQVSNNLAESLSDVQMEWNGIPERITVSEPKMVQVFQNLLANSVKFRDPNRPPVIEVSAKENPTDFLFSIQDNGIGIEKTYFDKIFMPFRKLHGPDKYPGSGIGLAICKRIIEQHGGKIWIESELGQGTTFFFTLKKAPPEKIYLYS